MVETAIYVTGPTEPGGPGGPGGPLTPPPPVFGPYAQTSSLNDILLLLAPPNILNFRYACVLKMVVLKMCASICVQIQFEFVKMKTTFLSIFLLTIHGVYCVQTIFCQSESFFNQLSKNMKTDLK